MATEYITTKDDRRLAYRRHDAGAALTFVWLSGFNSDMAGTKVLALEEWAQEAGVNFIAFDYSGHGESGGAFEDGTVSAWRADSLAILDELTTGPVVLVGSSMGGWMALLAAIARPQRVAGLVLIAPAPDFTEKLMWSDFPAAVQAEIMETGKYLRPSEYGDRYPITRTLIEDGRKWQILDAPIAFEGPVRILQGLEDPDVPWKHAEQLVTALTSTDVSFSLIKDGDHRLSRPQDIRRLLLTCREIAAHLGEDRA